MKLIRYGALAVVAALALTACGTGGGTSDDSSASGSSSGNGGGDKTQIRVWLVGASDTPQEAVDYLVSEYAKTHEDSEVVVERQVWDGLVDKLNSVLPTKDSPDVFEVGNTQAPAFTTIGAFEPLDDIYDDLGGDDLLQGFVKLGTADDTFYAAPYYAGSRLVFYRKDLLGSNPVPQTLDEYINLAKSLKAGSSDPNFSGLWWPGQDWRNALPYIWINGGDLAVEKDGQWEGALSTPESIAGLKQVQDLMTNASGAPKDGQETDPQISWCADTTAMFSAPGWAAGSLSADDKGGCSAKEAEMGVFALPGDTPAKTAPVFLGGSNIGISANSQHKDEAKDVMNILLSDEYQTILAQAGLVPAKVSLLPQMGDTDVAKASALAASNTNATPAAPGWTNVESDKIMEDLFVAIAQGGDVEQLAKDADAKITAAMNRDQ